MKKGRKTGSSKGQKKLIKSNPDIDCTDNKNEITAYFVSSADKYIPPDKARLPEVPVPSPDDAALPNSILCSAKCCKQKEINLKECKTNCETSEKTQNSEQQSTKNCDDILKDGSSPILLNGKNQCSKKKAKKNDPERKEKLLTDYFPVRRSNRNCKLTKIEKRKQFEEAILSGSEEGFEIKEFDGKGRGIITKRVFRRGDFVLEYYGELIDSDEAKKREKLYADDERNVGCYMYYFKYNNKQYCIDATKESGRLGRLVNHSKKRGNLKTQPFFIEETETPHLILIACRDIFPGEELLYDYGDRSKRSLESHPWLAS